MMDVSSAAGHPWPASSGPNSLPGNPQDQVPHQRPPLMPHLLPHTPRHPPPHRFPPIRPFFVREIYKNGFLKRLAHNEKKSSALSKLMRSDRYWVVFSVHDLGSEQLPFLELWHEPSEVTNRPPQFMFPLSMCQHISPSLVPADNEWTFVVNFETVAIRFSCNSRQTMEEWVECIRLKLCEMGILNPKGNLYSKVPLIPGQPKNIPSTGVGRNPMSPLPAPPTVSGTATTTTAATAESETAPSSEANSDHPQNVTSQPRSRTSLADAADQLNNQSFTTSIYLNQNSASRPEVSETVNPTSASAHVIPAKSYEPVTVVPGTPVTTTPSTATASSASGIKGIKWSVYLSKNQPSRHVTVIPINNSHSGDSKPASPTETAKELLASATLEEIDKRIDKGEEREEEHFYDAIFELEDNSPHSQPVAASSMKRPKRERKRQQSPPANPPPLPSPYETMILPNLETRTGEASEHRRSRAQRDETRSPTHRVKDPPIVRKTSDRLENRHPSGSHISKSGQAVRIKKKSQRSSSLGPFLDDNQMLLSTSLAYRSANTNSLESIDSNPRRAAAKNDPHHYQQVHSKEMGAVPRRPLQSVQSGGLAEGGQPGNGSTLMGSPPRLLTEFPRPIPPPYIPIVIPGHPGSSNGPQGSHTALTAHPPHIPLQGLACPLNPQPQNEHQVPHNHRPSLREQQVIRLRQEIAHPAGVRLVLRKRDCQGSLALVEFFGCLWVAGWKQRDFPVLYNTFHIGDQILSVAGVPVRTASEFNKLVKQKSGPSSTGANAQTEVLHVEIVVRRLPFAQVFHLKREIEGQPLGIVTHGNTAEVREIVPGSPASQHGMTPKIRSFDGQSLVSWVLTEINGRPLNLFSKDGEAGDRLQALGRDISVLLQPSDIIGKLKKHLKSLRNYKEYLLG